MSSPQQNGIDTTADGKSRGLRNRFIRASSKATNYAGKIISSRGDKASPVEIRQTTPQSPPKDNDPHLPVAAAFARPGFPASQTPGAGTAAGPFGTQPGQTSSSPPLTNGGHSTPGLSQNLYPTDHSLSLPPGTDTPFEFKYTDEGEAMKPETASDNDDTTDLIIQSPEETTTPSEHTGPVHEVHGDSRTVRPVELPLTTPSRGPAELDTPETMPGQRRSGYPQTRPNMGDATSFPSRASRGGLVNPAMAMVAANVAQARAAEGNTNPAQTLPQHVAPRKAVGGAGRTTPASPLVSRPPPTAQPTSTSSKHGRETPVATALNHAPPTTQLVVMSPQIGRATPQNITTPTIQAVNTPSQPETPQNTTTPTIQAVSTPSQTEPLGNENQEPQPVQQETADRTGTMSGESVTPGRTEQSPLPSRQENSTEEDPASDDGRENDQASTVVDEQATGPVEGQEPGFLNKFRLAKKNKPQTTAKPQTIVKASPHPQGYEDWQKRLKKVQKQHKIPENPLHDLLSNVVQWFMDQIQARDKTIGEKEQTIQARNTNIRTQEQEIQRLRLNLREQGERLQRRWDSAEKEKQEAQGERQRAENERQSALNSLATAESQARNAQASVDAAHKKLREKEENITGLLKERNAARQKAAQYLQDISARKEEQEATLEELRTTKANLDAAIRERNQLDLDFTDYWKKSQKTKQELQTELATVVQNYEDDKARVEATHKEETDRLSAELDGMKGKYKAKLKNETARLNVQVRNLQTRMASYSNRDTGGAIPDDELRSNFLQLARRINNLISWVPRPSTHRSVPELDPDDFLIRTAQQGSRNWPKFVRSVCWRVIVKGFFSRQFGFGAFGSQAGEGFKALDQLYQLFAIPDPKNPRGPCVRLPPTKDMNVWRAGFFSAVLKLVRQGSGPNNVYIRLYKANVERVADDLAASLELVTGSALGAEAREEMTGFVSGLGTLALEMASQRSHVSLETCERGRPVSAEMFKSESEQGYGDAEVDIMTQPCIKRVGDGQDDLRAERIIAQGEFVPLRGY